MQSVKWIAVVALAVLVVDVAAQPPGGGRPGGRPSFDRLLTAFDADGDGELAEEEVPPPVWTRLSQADADGDGYVSRTEFDSYRPGGGT